MRTSPATVVTKPVFARSVLARLVLLLAATLCSYSAIATDINKLDEGDMLYVTGWFGHLDGKKVQVVRVDLERGEVKVRDAETGMTEWVSPSQLFTHSERTVDILLGPVNKTPPRDIIAAPARDEADSSIYFRSESTSPAATEQTSPAATEPTSPAATAPADDDPIIDLQAPLAPEPVTAQTAPAPAPAVPAMQNAATVWLCLHSTEALTIQYFWDDPTQRFNGLVYASEQQLLPASPTAGQWRQTKLAHQQATRLTLTASGAAGTAALPSQQLNGMLSSGEVCQQANSYYLIADQGQLKLFSYAEMINRQP